MPIPSHVEMAIIREINKNEEIIEIVSQIKEINAQIKTKEIKIKKIEEEDINPMSFLKAGLEKHKKAIKSKKKDESEKNINQLKDERGKLQEKVKQLKKQENKLREDLKKIAIEKYQKENFQANQNLSVSNEASNVSSERAPVSASVVSSPPPPPPPSGVKVKKQSAEVKPAEEPIVSPPPPPPPSVKKNISLAPSAGREAFLKQIKERRTDDNTDEMRARQASDPVKEDFKSEVRSVGDDDDDWETDEPSKGEQQQKKVIFTEDEKRQFVQAMNMPLTPRAQAEVKPPLPLIPPQANTKKVEEVKEVKRAEEEAKQAEKTKRVEVLKREEEAKVKPPPLPLTPRPQAKQAEEVKPASKKTAFSDFSKKTSVANVSLPLKGAKPVPSKPPLPSTLRPVKPVSTVSALPLEEAKPVEPPPRLPPRPVKPVSGVSALPLAEAKPVEAPLFPLRNVVGADIAKSIIAFDIKKKYDEERNKKHRFYDWFRPRRYEVIEQLNLNLDEHYKKIKDSNNPRKILTEITKIKRIINAEINSKHNKKSASLVPVLKEFKNTLEDIRFECLYRIIDEKETSFLKDLNPLVEINKKGKASYIANFDSRFNIGKGRVDPHVLESSISILFDFLKQCEEIEKSSKIFLTNFRHGEYSFDEKTQKSFEMHVRNINRAMDLQEKYESAPEKERAFIEKNIIKESLDGKMKLPMLRLSEYVMFFKEAKHYMNESDMNENDPSYNGINACLASAQFRFKTTKMGMGIASMIAAFDIKKEYDKKHGEKHLNIFKTSKHDIVEKLSLEIFERRNEIKKLDDPRMISNEINKIIEILENEINKKKHKENSSLLPVLKDFKEILKQIKSVRLGRAIALKELTDTESSFSKHLNLLQAIKQEEKELFVANIAKEAHKKNDIAEHVDVFFDFLKQCKVIESSSEDFLYKLKNKNYSFDKETQGAFIEHAKNINKAVQLQEEYQKIPKEIQVLIEKEVGKKIGIRKKSLFLQEDKDVTADSIMTLPTQHAARYALLFAEAQKHINKDEPSYNGINFCLANVELLFKTTKIGKDIASMIGNFDIKKEYDEIRKKKFFKTTPKYDVITKIKLSITIHCENIKKLDDPEKILLEISKIIEILEAEIGSKHNEKRSSLIPVLKDFKKVLKKIQYECDPKRSESRKSIVIPKEEVGKKDLAKSAVHDPKPRHSVKPHKK